VSEKLQELDEWEAKREETAAKLEQYMEELEYR